MPVSLSDSKQESQVEICLFNEFSIKIGGEYCRIQNKKARETLAYLISHNGGPVRKSALAGDLWPNSSPEKALDSLYKVLSFLRNHKLLNSHLPITAQREELWLDTSGISCDISIFEHCRAQKDNIDACRKAVELYRGPFLFHEYYEWTAEKEAYYDLLYIETVRHLYEHYTQTGERGIAYYYRKILSSAM